MSFIETPRLLIRKWMPGDAADLSQIYGDPETMRHIPSGPLDPEQTRAAIAKMSDDDERGEFGPWPVILKETGKLIGECGLQYLDRTPEVEVGWVLADAVRGNGYATEAAAAVLEFGFSALSLPRIVAIVAPENRASIAVVNRLHMWFDRVARYYHRDFLRYHLDRPSNHGLESR
ncbi:MAG: GNAT family N-acetyltransferase [Candidatus Baltobacteraceae bacterium]